MSLSTVSITNLSRLVHLVSQSDHFVSVRLRFSQASDKPLSDLSSFLRSPGSSSRPSTLLDCFPISTSHLHLPFLSSAHCFLPRYTVLLFPFALFGSLVPFLMASLFDDVSSFLLVSTRLCPYLASGRLIDLLNGRPSLVPKR